MLQRSISYGVCLLRTCGYCCVLAGGRHQRSDVPGPRYGAPARGAAWRNKASAQHGGAAWRNKASAQHGATRRARSTAAHGVSVASAQHSIELPVRLVTSICFVC